MEISSQVRSAVVFAPAGAVEASTLADEARGAELARAANELLGAAADVREGAAAVNQLEVATAEATGNVAQAVVEGRFLDGLNLVEVLRHADDLRHRVARRDNAADAVVEGGAAFRSLGLLGAFLLVPDVRRA